jgi:phosphohistidine phosphatase
VQTAVGRPAKRATSAEREAGRAGGTLGCTNGPATHPSRTRHAKTEDTRPGSKDSERRLTPDGERAVLEVGDYLRTQGIAVDTVLCSSAVRARQTLDLLKLGDQLPPDRIDIADRFYNAGTDTLINAVRELPDDCHVALLVGNAPGAPGVVYELTDPATSTPEAVSAIEGRFPAAARPSWSSRATGRQSRPARSSPFGCPADSRRHSQLLESQS